MDCSDKQGILEESENHDSEMFDSTRLKIQLCNREVKELSKREENMRKKTCKRLVGKNGRQHLLIKGSKIIRGRKLRDGFTTFMELGWISTILVFSSCFFVSWLFFAILWHLIAWLHGDLEPLNLPRFQQESNYIPCVYWIEDFSSSFLFSMETQTSIGYGMRVSSNKCSSAIVLQCLQTVIGILIDAVVVGLFFVKISRPGRRAVTVVFSKNAVITKRNGKLRLVFQVANAQNSQLIEAHFRGQVLMQTVTDEGEVINNFSKEIKVSSQIEDNVTAIEDRGLFLLPIQVSHTIDEESPLYSMDPETLLTSNIEFIFSMEAVVEPSGNTTQALTSFLPDEILWGFRFESCANWDQIDRAFHVDLSRMNHVIRDETPFISSRSSYSSGGADKENL